jgi:uncharacterized protein YjcR
MKNCHITLCNNPSRLCGAKTRKGTPCKSHGMRNGRCRMHGGKSTGPPKGSQNALKHGLYSREKKEEWREIKQTLKQAKDLVKLIR